ncbi:MAG: hypothetical protein ACRDTD_17285 [Pseudonocardiaceae bacterium]
MAMSATGGERITTDTGALGAAVATIVAEHLAAFAITDTNPTIVSPGPDESGTH